MNRTAVGLSRASTFFVQPEEKDVDGRDKVCGPGTWVTPFGDMGNGFISGRFASLWM
jgi:hypothetical protein